jgi:hypothetical protein
MNTEMLMLHDKWLTARLKYLRDLKSPTSQQRILMLLADKLGRTHEDSQKLAALVRAEAAAERAQKIRDMAAHIVEEDREAALILEALAYRKHDRDLYSAVELLLLADLVESRAGTPAFDRGELLGALIALARVPADDPRRREWKREGNALLAQNHK